MTNFEVILHTDLNDKEKCKKTIDKLSSCLADKCEHIIAYLCHEQGLDGYIEVSNFDKADMIAEFKSFFNHEITGRNTRKGL